MVNVSPVFSTVLATREILGPLARGKTSQFNWLSEVEHTFSDPVFLSQGLQDLAAYMWRTLKLYKLALRSHLLGIQCSRAHWSRQPDSLFLYLPMSFFSSLKNECLKYWNYKGLFVENIRIVKCAFHKVAMLESRFKCGGKVSPPCYFSHSLSI